MIVPKPNETIKGVFEAEGPHGYGRLYITNIGVYFESCKYGKIVDLPYDVIGRYCITNDQKFRIDWRDNAVKRYYDMSVKSPMEVFSAYEKANKEYAESTLGCDKTCPQN